ncbi:hypothetical protein DL95DRAFT_384996 [Leptodontidium sp. 2 PMI_412]|nr:hypothetical protein DL95DRAFT_384996 [Leptodontidium sp. 2 PMI_412]
MTFDSLPMWFHPGPETSTEEWNKMMIWNLGMSVIYFVLMVNWLKKEYEGERREGGERDVEAEGNREETEERRIWYAI